MGPFEVTKDMVSRLGDVTLPELLSRLLEAEARQRGISQAAISVGGTQTAADGGVDASIAWNDGFDPQGWLPRRTIFFQSKAETMTPGKLVNEMRPKGIARPIFAQLARPAAPTSSFRRRPLPPLRTGATDGEGAEIEAGIYQRSDDPNDIEYDVSEILPDDASISWRSSGLFAWRWHRSWRTEDPHTDVRPRCGCLQRG